MSQATEMKQATDFEVGAELPELKLPPVNRTTLALFCGASGDHNPIHVDIDFARAGGHTDVFAHGMLSMGLAARLVGDWATTGRIKRLSARFTAITRIGDVILLEGKVTEVTGDGDAIVDISAAIEGGDTTLIAKAVLHCR